MKLLKPLTTLAVGVALAGTAAFAVAPAAQADPATGASYKYTAAGSDTIQDLYNSFQTGNSIASWNATVPGKNGDAGLGSTITPKSVLNANTAGTTIGRPNGSGDGRAALSAAWNPNSSTWNQTVKKTTGTTTTPYTVPSESISIARSSGKPSSAHLTSNGAEDDLTSVPLARDAVSVATYGFSFNFTEPELQAIFGAPDTSAVPDSVHGVYTQSTSGPTVGDIQKTANSNGVTTAVSLVTAVNNGVATLQPLNVKLPQASSGTRQFFQNAIGNSGNSTAPWVNDTNEENHADALTTVGDIIPFSAAQFIGQYNQVVTDTGVTKADFHLNSIAGEDAYTLSGVKAVPGALFGNTGTVPNGTVGTFDRDVYSVVPTAVINGTFSAPSSDSTYDSDVTTLVTSTLPNSGNISNYGFDPITYSNNSADWIHSSWEN